MTTTSQIMPTKHYSAGQVIFQEGEQPNGVYLICEGDVEISRTQDGQKLVLANVGKDCIFGEMALVDNRPRSATATATSSTWCYLLSKHSFENKLNELDPFMRGLFRILVSNLRAMNDRLGNAGNSKAAD